MSSPVATALATALCDDLSDEADLMVDELVDAGVSVEDICLEHLAPAARCLGQWWETDRLPFTEVAMATSRIQSILRRMPVTGVPRATGARGAVFCAVPGEQHTLGVMMAADLFRRHAWDVSLLIGCEHDELMSCLLRDDRTVIGISCSGTHSFGALRHLMPEIQSRRPDAHVLLSGQIVSDDVALSKLPKPYTVVATMQDAEVQLQRLEALPVRGAVSGGHASVA